MSAINFVVTLEIRNRLAALMSAIKVAGGYYTDVVTVGTIWENFKNLDKSKLPALYVTTETDDANLVPLSKFGEASTPLDETFRLSIMGRFGLKTGESIEDTQEKFSHDVKRAYLVNPTLNNLVEPRAWHVRRAQPWLPADGRLFFQALITVRCLEVHYRAGGS